MVLSKAAFIHRKYLELYTHDMPASVRNYVTNKRLLLNDILYDILQILLKSTGLSLLVISEVFNHEDYLLPLCRHQLIPIK
jgi:hypothetical protein